MTLEERLRRVEAERDALREEVRRVRIGLRDQTGRSRSYRPLVMLVQTCKDGKPPHAGEGRVPALMRHIGDDEQVSVEGFPWFVIMYAPVEVFGEYT